MEYICTVGTVCLASENVSEATMVVSDTLLHNGVKALAIEKLWLLVSRQWERGSCWQLLRSMELYPLEAHDHLVRVADGDTIYQHVLDVPAYFQGCSFRHGLAHTKLIGDRAEEMLWVASFQMDRWSTLHFSIMNAIKFSYTHLASL